MMNLLIAAMSSGKSLVNGPIDCIIEDLVCTALAATVGTGNIAGVAGAIAIGGPGAVFWMWISALLGMCTKFSEVTLAVHFREKNAEGDLVGGPMYYIKNGLKKQWHWLAYLFAAFGVLTVFGTGNATQVNTITTAIDSALYNYGVISEQNVSTLNLVIGIILGLLAGYIGGKTDVIIMRIADIMLSIPSLLLAMVIMYTLGSSTINLFLALSMINWASVARVVRSQTLSLKESEYVEAARSIGVSRWKIMIRHILPNCIPSLIVLFTLEVPSSILSESSLSFLGIGVQPPAASWGLMVNQAKQFLFTQPWLCLAPCLSIMVVVLAFNFLGDGLRDVLDPYMKNS